MGLDVTAYKKVELVRAASIKEARTLGLFDEFDKPPYDTVYLYCSGEGFIGPQSCRELAADFDTHIFVAAKAAVSEWLLDYYRSWQKAFHHAADTGVVRLH
jgi:hypothetical protein